MQVGAQVIRFGSPTVGVVEQLYPAGIDRYRIPHSRPDALVSWPDGVTNYEYQDVLTVVEPTHNES